MDWVEMVAIEISNRCNYAGMHPKCPASIAGEIQTMPFRLIHKILAELGSIKYQNVIIFSVYNEPMIDPRFLAILEAQLRLAPLAHVNILTNGFYLDQNILDELAEFKIAEIFVNAYTPDEEVRLQKLQAPQGTKYRVHGRAKLDGRMGIYGAPAKDCLQGCPSAERNINIRVGGEVIFCCMDWQTKYPIGSVSEEPLSVIAGRWPIVIPLCKRCGKARR